MTIFWCSYKTGPGGAVGSGRIIDKVVADHARWNDPDNPDFVSFVSSSGKAVYFANKKHVLSIQVER